MDIKGKAAWISGAAAGIGQAIAIALAEKGARHLFLCDIDGDGLATTERVVTGRGASVSIRTLDVSELAEFERAIEEANQEQGLDIVVNNAGIAVGVPEYPEMSTQRISRLIAINLTAVTVATAVAARLMVERGGGVIINTASTAALNPKLSDAPYRASKAGVITLTECCKKLSEQGVRVNAVAPGITDTPILYKVGDGINPPAWLEAARSQRHILTPEEVAIAFVELIEDDSRAGVVVQLPNELL